MKISWRTEWVHWLLIAGMWILAALSWSSAPARIPVHWGLNGQANRYGGKVEGLLLLPALALGLYVLMIALPRWDPGRANYRAFAGSYTLIRLLLTTLLAVIYGIVQLQIHGSPLATNTVIPLVVGGLFIILGNQMGKLRPNWFVGIRTPWTLSSKMAWVKTHRFGGWVFMGMGVAQIAVGLLHAVWATKAMLGLIILGTLVICAYSYLAWRKDPAKVPPAGTLPGEE